MPSHTVGKMPPLLTFLKRPLEYSRGTHTSLRQLLTTPLGNAVKAITIGISL
jgi:hypothetical protein